MEPHDFLTNLASAVLAAMIGGFLARAFRLPLLVGYIAAGMAVGPHTPGVAADVESVRQVAKLGVALLMFAVGVQFRLEDMLRIRRIALLGGGFQITGTILLGWAIGRMLGWESYAAAFLGCALALSSTAVMMRVLEERGELGTGHGTVMLGILIVQDLSMVLMVTLLPAFAPASGAGGAPIAGVAVSLLRAAGLLALTLLLARTGVPALLRWTARANSRELFLLVVVVVCLGAAYLSELGGLSLELGAFLAGLVISESEYAHEVFAQVRPLRDLFASLFFVSIGMLMEPPLLIRYAPAIAAVVLAILLGKSLIAMLPIYALGLHGRTVVLAGLGLAQIGEFSFVLASIGTERGLIGEQVAGVILASALITILLAPFVFASGMPLYRTLNAVPSFARVLNRQGMAEPAAPAEEARARVLLLGGGRVGSHVSDALRRRGIPHAVVDYDPEVVDRLRVHGIPVIYGDATSEVVLARALTPSVELAIIALPETSLTPIAVRLIKLLNRHLPVVARVHRASSVDQLRGAGADAVVHAEFEAATEMIRHCLGRLRCPETETEAYIEELKRACYRG